MNSIKQSATDESVGILMGSTNERVRVNARHEAWCVTIRDVGREIDEVELAIRSVGVEFTAE